ncbi:hypothetical protein CLV81_3038 [Flagellimonas meridianipacifica]|uniref:Uncharacterized protein n=1 Tax=Flagellimonas meridianipacifica TaxID=1080225 RepID=A0A2T0MAU4_9FLAO|nr:hypothetical protein CLV81_3038 [Allomuricauda pacifica]
MALHARLSLSLVESWVAKAKIVDEVFAGNDPNQLDKVFCCADTGHFKTYHL